MKNLASTTIFAIITLLLVSCVTPQNWQKALLEDADEIDNRLVNYALPENGTLVLASEDNPDHSVLLTIVVLGSRKKLGTPSVGSMKS